MPWQDAVLTGGALVLFIALLPSVFSKSKPAAATSIMTGIVLAIFSVTYTTLGLWFAATTTGITSLTWFVLFWQVSWPTIKSYVTRIYNRLKNQN